MLATVYMEVDVDPTQHEVEAEYVIDLCERDNNPMLAATIGGRPADPGFADYVERFAGSKYVKGVRQVLHGGILTSKLSERGLYYWRAAARGRRVYLDLCPAGRDLAGTEMVDRCPNTRLCWITGMDPFAGRSIAMGEGTSPEMARCET